MATTGDKDSETRQTESTRKQSGGTDRGATGRTSSRSSGSDTSRGTSSGGSSGKSGSNGNSDGASGSGTGKDQSGSTQNGRVPIAEAMRLAAGQLAELLRSEPDSVSSMKATGDGWTAEIEVVEIERVPDTTSVMGSYLVQLDGKGNLLGYERTRRYSRGQIDQRK